MATTRKAHELRAFAHDGPYVYRHHFVLGAEFGGTFSAIAIRREGAECVLDAEVPGASLTARYDGVTTVPCYRERARDEALIALRAVRP
jgi:hypothetical protein